jgi:GT2 family glycosyltransferase
MRFSVVIPTRGRPDSLRGTLESLARCDPEPEEVLVVDGDPARSAEGVVGEALPRARYLATEPGLTRQRNAALAGCTGDVVLFIDDDVALDSALFAHLAEAYRDPSVVGATGRVIEPASRRFGHKHAPIRRLLLGSGPQGSFTRFGYPRYVLDVDREHDVEVMQGCFMSARRETALAVGFDEGLEGYGLAEDEDFSYRLSRRGRIRYAPRAVLEHKKTGFSTHDPRALGRVAVRNRAYLFRKNFRRTPLARVQFVFLLVLLLGQRLVNREWAGARGVLEGAVEAWRERK